MTFTASHTLVFGCERERRGLVAGLRKRRRPESLVGVTRAALAMVGAVSELSLVLVLMAVHALFVRHRRFEIRGLVTLLAGEPGVLAVERELRGGVIEVRRQAVYGTPCRGVVTGFASCDKSAAVRILVTPGALCEAQLAVLDHLGVVGHRAMALFALQIGVLSRQGILGLR